MRLSEKTVRETVRTLQERGMTQDESEQVEELVMIWYGWTIRYRPQLGAPRVSVYGKGSGSPDHYAEPEEIDARIDADKAEQVEVCIDALPWQQRSSIDLHASRKASGIAVMRNPRIPAGEIHSLYQSAKDSLLPMLRRRGMIK